jgi:Zn-dependent protease
MWVACVFVSILVHEFGHGLMAKSFHGSPSVVLYALGGLCSSQGERTPGQRLAVLFGGPGAGFALCAMVMLIASLLYGISPGEHAEILLNLLGLSSNFPSALDHFPSRIPKVLYVFMVEINFLWGLVNLLPVWPLDGGQATQVILTMFDRRHGVRRGHIVSLLTAGIIAVFAASRERYYLALMFGILAFMNYQSLQSLHQASSFGLDHDDDWWRG